MLKTQSTHQDEKASGPRIGLALAGGGPLGGIYEIGALLALNEPLDGVDFHELDVYVWVSAGSFVAATLANGFAVAEMGRLFVSRRVRPQRFKAGVFLRPAFAEYVRCAASVPGLRASGLWRYLSHPLKHGFLECISDVSRAVPTAIFDNRPIERFLGELFSNRDMTNDRRLKRKLLLVAMDLDTGEAVRFGSPGQDDVPISQAVQASMALPGLYPPVRIRGRYFVDGSLKRTLHASAALDAGANLLFCINPIGPFDASVAPPDQHKRLDLLIEGGLPVVLAQTLRALICSRMFFANVFSYANRELVCQHAYRTTRRDLWQRRQQLAPILARHGVAIREHALKDAERHFTKALARTPDPKRLGVYRNRVTNRLDGVLDRLEAELGRSA